MSKIKKKNKIVFFADRKDTMEVTMVEADTMKPPLLPVTTRTVRKHHG